VDDPAPIKCAFEIFNVDYLSTQLYRVKRYCTHHGIMDIACDISPTVLHTLRKITRSHAMSPHVESDQVKVLGKYGLFILGIAEMSAVNHKR
jgi:hypothetical protein